MESLLRNPIVDTEKWSQDTILLQDACPGPLLEDCYAEPHERLGYNLDGFSGLETVH